MCEANRTAHPSRRCSRAIRRTLTRTTDQSGHSLRGADSLNGHGPPETYGADSETISRSVAGATEVDRPSAATSRTGKAGLRPARSSRHPTLGTSQSTECRSEAGSPDTMATASVRTRASGRTPGRSRTRPPDRCTGARPRLRRGVCWRRRRRTKPRKGRATSSDRSRRPSTGAAPPRRRPGNRQPCCRLSWDRPRTRTELRRGTGTETPGSAPMKDRERAPRTPARRGEWHPGFPRRTRRSASRRSLKRCSHHPGRPLRRGGTGIEAKKRPTNRRRSRAPTARGSPKERRRRSPHDTGDLRTSPHRRLARGDRHAPRRHRSEGNLHFRMVASRTRERRRPSP